MTNPFRAFMDVKREELPFALLMFSYFFMVIASFWILKPLKKGLFITFYDQTGFRLFSWHMEAAQAELLAKVLNMLVAVAAVTVFTLAARRLRRQQLTYIFSAFILAAYVAYSMFIDRAGSLTIWTFYLFGDLYSTLMVATFFAFLNDSVVPDQAKRIYGLVGLGGVMGGVFGTTILRGFIDTLATSTWLWVTFGIGLLITTVAFMAGRIVDRHPPLESRESEPPPDENGGNPAIEGAKLVFRSRYLLSIVAIVGIYEIVSTVMDFQFTSTIAHFLDGEDIGRQFTTMFAITNWTSMLVQLFLTGFIMTRFGLAVALLVLPVTAAMGSMAFLAVPFLWVGSFLNTADNGFSYSINQSAKEALYVPTTRDEKYKAKAFIDMFVQRFAKALAVGVSLLMTTLFDDFSGIRWLGLFTLLMIVIWVAAARYAGRKFKERTT